MLPVLTPGKGVKDVNPSISFLDIGATVINLSPFKILQTDANIHLNRWCFISQ
jgi:hypothetical protein